MSNESSKGTIAVHPLAAFCLIQSICQFLKLQETEFLMLEKDFEDFILKAFREMLPDAQISRGLYSNEVSLIISAPSQESIKAIWARRCEISTKACELGICQWISLCVVGHWFYPPWMPQTFARHP